MIPCPCNNFADVLLKSYDSIQDFAAGQIISLNNVLGGDARLPKDMAKSAQQLTHVVRDLHLSTPSCVIDRELID